MHLSTQDWQQRRDSLFALIAAGRSSSHNASRLAPRQRLPKSAGPTSPARLPVYPGYEWRRSGPDVVLIAVGTGIVYEILDGVLN